jgi:hypothetical protein
MRADASAPRETRGDTKSLLGFVTAVGRHQIRLKPTKSANAARKAGTSTTAIVDARDQNVRWIEAAFAGLLDSTRLIGWLIPALALSDAELLAVRRELMRARRSADT